ADRFLAGEDDRVLQIIELPPAPDTVDHFVLMRPHCFLPCLLRRPVHAGLLLSNLPGAHVTARSGSPSHRPTDGPAPAGRARPGRRRGSPPGASPPGRPAAPRSTPAARHPGGSHPAACAAPRPPDTSATAGEPAASVRPAASPSAPSPTVLPFPLPQLPLFFSLVSRVPSLPITIATPGEETRAVQKFSPENETAAVGEMRSHRGQATGQGMRRPTGRLA